LVADLEALKSSAEDVQSEEQDYLDNMPEGLQGGEKGEAAQSAIDALDEVICNIETAVEGFNTAMEG
jgi:hypothetical protein